MLKSQLVQNTAEWVEFRKDRIGASDAPIIMAVSPWKTPFQLWEEKIGMRKTYVNAAMRRGLNLEENARCQFEKQMNIYMFPMVAIHPEKSWMIASLDGIDIEAKYIVEIKCAGKVDHQSAQLGKIPAKYYPQVQHQMAVTGLEMAYYFSYNGFEGVTLEIPRDDTYIQALIAKEEAFLRCLQEFIAPDI